MKPNYISVLLKAKADSDTKEYNGIAKFSMD